MRYVFKKRIICNQKNKEMKKVNTIAVAILLTMTGCGGKSGSESDILITVDITKTYPQKEMILQDFMDVEYIPLETTDEFVNQGVVLAIGKEIILVKNQINDGDLFIYDKNGKGLRKINRKGQGGEEYLSISEAVLDEDNSEILVNDFLLGKIMVYDLYGKFLRSFPYEEGVLYGNLCNYDRENLICYDASMAIDFTINTANTNESMNYKNEETNKSSYYIISKRDGSIMKDIQIYIKKKQALTGLGFYAGGPRVARSTYFPLIPYNDSWIMTEYSSDTVFSFSPDYSMDPLLVRTPSIQSMDPKVLLYLGIITDRYLFMKTEMNQTGSGNRVAGVVTKDHLVYDKQEKTVYESIVYNGDFSNEITVDMSMQSIIANEIVCMQKIEAFELVEAYRKGQLNGKLKEIAVKLDEEDNPVIMLLKQKR